MKNYQKDTIKIMLQYVPLPRNAPKRSDTP